jgi:chemosensory pili system protein ChpC
MSTRISKKKATRKTTTRRKTLVRDSGSRSVNGQGATAHREFSASRIEHNLAAPLSKVHCALAPLPLESLLLPTNVIAEVIDYREPVPLSGTPQWFLGQIEWESRQVPVFSYAALVSGEAPGKISDKNRIMVVKSLSDSARMPYLGILISDIPTLVSVQQEEVVHTGDERKSLGVFCHVKVQEKAAIIPDLDRLTHLVTHAAYGILPITQVQS